MKKFMEAYNRTLDIWFEEKSEAAADHGTEIMLTLKTDI